VFRFLKGRVNFGEDDYLDGFAGPAGLEVLFDSIQQTRDNPTDAEIEAVRLYLLRIFQVKWFGAPQISTFNFNYAEYQPNYYLAYAVEVCESRQLYGDQALNDPLRAILDRSYEMVALFEITFNSDGIMMCHKDADGQSISPPIPILHAKDAFSRMVVSGERTLNRIETEKSVYTRYQNYLLFTPKLIDVDRDGPVILPSPA